MSERWRTTFGAATTAGFLAPAAQRATLAALPRFATGIETVCASFESLFKTIGPDWEAAVAYRRVVRLARDPARHAATYAVFTRVAPPPSSPSELLIFQRLLLESENPLADATARRAALEDARALAAGPLASEPDAAVEVALSALFGELVPGLAAPDLAAARDAATVAEAALAGCDSAWDGERVATWMASATVLIQLDRAAHGEHAPVRLDAPTPAEIRRVLTAAHVMAAGAGAVADAGQAVTGLAPLLIAGGEQAEAVSRLSPLVKACPHPLMGPQLELRLRQLLITAHEKANAVGAAITELYTAMERCRALDALPMLLVLVAQGPALYLSVNMPEEARRFVAAARVGFATRQDGRRDELLAFCDALTRNLDAQPDRAT